MGGRERERERKSVNIISHITGVIGSVKRGDGMICSISFTFRDAFNMRKKMMKKNRFYLRTKR